MVSKEVKEALYNEEIRTQLAIQLKQKEELDVLFKELAILKPALESLRKDNTFQSFSGSSHTNGRLYSEEHEIIVDLNSAVFNYLKVDGITLHKSSNILRLSRLRRALFGPIFFRNLDIVVNSIEKRILELLSLIHI